MPIYNAGMNEAVKRIAVTGGSGRIGGVVVRELIDRGYSVVNLDQRQAADPVTRFVYLDLRHRAALQPVLEQVDAVIHLGEIPHMGHHSHDQVFATNTAIASTVIQTAADLRLRRVIYTSSCQAYGTWGGSYLPPVALPVTEDQPLRPQNGYALSKMANEAFSRLISEQAGLRVSVFRLPWVMSDNSMDRVLHWLGRSRSGRVLEMGTYVHARDVARAYAMAIEKDLGGWQVYNLSAADVSLSVPLATMLRNDLPEYPPLPKDWPDFRSPLMTDRAQEELGWSPQFSIREAFQQAMGRPLEAPAPVS